MQKNTLALTMIASLLFATSACQPPEDMADTPNAQTIKEPSTKPLIEAKTPKALTTALVTLSEEQLTNKLVCTKLSATMQDIDNKSKIESITAVQRQLKACLPITDNRERLQWLAEYQALYGRFLGSDDYRDDDNFYAVVDTIKRGKRVTVEQLKAMSPRRRYLISLVESNADVSLLYVGEGIFVFHHDLQAMADLFAPYLPDEQAEFIQRMAQDNQDIFWNDAAVAVPFEEVVNRAIFWEDYTQRYPIGYFTTDAKYLLSIYRDVLFFGSNNTQWTEDTIHEFIDLKHKQAVQQLAKRLNSVLAQDAQVYLDFIALSDSERQQKYPVPNKDSDGYKIENWMVPRYQLRAALPIPSPWEADNNKDCMTGVICMDTIINSK